MKEILSLHKPDDPYCICMSCNRKNERIFGLSRDDLNPTVDPWEVLVALKEVWDATKPTPTRQNVLGDCIAHVSSVLSRPKRLEDFDEDI